MKAKENTMLCFACHVFFVRYGEQWVFEKAYPTSKVDKTNINNFLCFDLCK